MSDPRDTGAHDNDEGATPQEQLISACRNDSTDLLKEILEDFQTKQKSKEEIALFLNDAKDPLGNYALHVAAKYGSFDVLDELLYQDGLEVDPISRMDGDTPLHTAVKFAAENAELGLEIVKVLIECGADPRVQNKHKQKAIQLVDPRQTELKSVLQKAEYAQMMAGDAVQDDSDGEGEGSGSDSG